MTQKSGSGPAAGKIPDKYHGTRYGYIYYRCRCVDCRAANTHYLKFARMVRTWRLRQDPTLAKHGTRSTYINWGCRCDPCTQAHSKACKEYDQRRKVLNQQKGRDGTGEDGRVRADLRGRSG